MLFQRADGDVDDGAVLLGDLGGFRVCRPRRRGWWCLACGALTKGGEVGVGGGVDDVAMRENAEGARRDSNHGRSRSLLRIPRVPLLLTFVRRQRAQLDSREQGGTEGPACSRQAGPAGDDRRERVRVRRGRERLKGVNGHGGIRTTVTSVRSLRSLTSRSLLRIPCVRRTTRLAVARRSYGHGGVSLSRRSRGWN